MATYPPRRLLGARPLPSDPRRDPRRSDFPGGGGGSPRNLRCLFTHFQGPAARHHQLLRRLKWKTGKVVEFMLTKPSRKASAAMTRLKFIHQK
ncbi:uncharacterized protein AAG666_022636 isoform 3-T4 [Megaptera novaeangliae]